MNVKKIQILICLFILALLLLQVGGASLAAPAEDVYELTSWFETGGGGPWMQSEDQTYGMGATMGQPGVGEGPMEGGEYSLTSGYWALPQEGYIYLPILLK